jgi:hypothetical protein
MDEMETQIESLPGSENIQIPHSIERQLQDPQQIQVPQQIQEPQYRVQQQQQQQQQPNVSFSITKKSPDFVKQFTSKEFALLILLLLLADSRYINVLISRHLPIDFIKNSTLLKTMFKVGLLALAFILVRAYFLKV